MSKSLNEISWNVTEEEYRVDEALSYSTLATYERSGFNGLSTLFDRKESPSLTFGSAVDAIITGGREEFDAKFIVAEYPNTPDTIIKIIKELFAEFNITHQTLEEIPDIEVLGRANTFEYQTNWRPETRVKNIKEKGAEYYNLLHLAEGKTIINSDTYQKVLNAVSALKESDSTKWYFADDNPFDDSIRRYYQLKFKATLDGIDYRCMADEIICDTKNKKIYLIDLKTSSHTEWDFYKSFVDWSYMIQGRLYFRIIEANLKKDEYFKDFKIEPYRFIVVNKETLTPLVWIYSDTFAVGELKYGRFDQIVCRDPEVIGKELHNYLVNTPRVPNEIDLNGDNKLTQWLKKL